MADRNQTPDDGGTHHPADRRSLQPVVERLELVVDHAPVRFMTLDAERRVCWLNRHDDGDGSPLGVPAEELCHPDDRAEARAAIDRAVAGEISTYESRGVPPAEGRWLSYRCVPLPPERAPERVLVMALDVSAERAAMGALRASERRYRRLVDAMPDLLALIDEDFRVLWSNRYDAVSEQEALGRPLTDFVVPSERVKVEGMLAEAFSTGELVTREVVTEVYGPRMVFQMRAIPVSDAPPQLLLLSTDVSAERAATRALQASDQRYRRLTENMPDFINEIDRDLRILWTNRYAEGLSPDDVIGRSMERFTAPANHDRMRAAVAEAFETQTLTSYDVQAAHDLPEVGGRWFRTRVVPLPLEGHALTLVADITEQKEAEIALRASEERLERAMTATGIGLWEWLPARDEVRSDRHWVEAEARSGEPHRESVAGWDAAVHPDDRAALREIRDALLRGDRDDFEVEYRLSVHGARGWRWILHRARAFERGPDGAPVRVVGTQLDVTERRRVEEERRSLQLQLQHAQRVESVGQLAGGVAHDFNNLLLVILNQAQMARDAIARGDAEPRDLEPVLEAAERAATLTRQLLAFGRRQRLLREPVDVGALLRAREDFLRRLFPPHIRIEVNVPDEPLVIEADKAQLEQVLLNLCVNARDALPRGGTLTMSARRTTVAVEALRAGDEAQPGRFVALTVADDGPGMDEDVASRIFEPFFTTKAPGRGTGLGLAVVDGIVKQHGGFIRLQTRPGRGATFHIHLPATGRAVKRSTASARAPARGGSETVLVAEDEPMVGRMVERLLTSAGYDVRMVGDGREALAVLDAEADGVDLLLADVVMPRMGGYELTVEVRRRWPGLPVILTTGYGGGALPNTLQGERIPIVSKPYLSEVLLAAIRKALGEAGRPR